MKIKITKAKANGKDSWCMTVINLGKRKRKWFKTYASVLGGEENAFTTSSR